MQNEIIAPLKIVKDGDEPYPKRSGIAFTPIKIQVEN
jgi:hypothetical protein